jgi:opine dehydrogenase
VRGVVNRSVRAAGSRARVAWAETGTLPYLARKHGEREVNLTMRAVRLPTSVYPAQRAVQALALIREAYPSVHGCGDALSGALMNAGPVIRPPLMVMNAAPLQHFERWDIPRQRRSVRSAASGALARPAAAGAGD